MSMDEKLMQRVKEGWKECCILNDSIADEPEISGEEDHGHFVRKFIHVQILFCVLQL